MGRAKMEKISAGILVGRGSATSGAPMGEQGFFSYEWARSVASAIPRIGGQERGLLDWRCGQYKEGFIPDRRSLGLASKVTGK